GVLVVAGKLGLVAAVLLLSTLAGVILGSLGISTDARTATLATNLAGLLAPILLTTLVYATMPRRRLPARDVLVAGLVAGLLIGAFTSAFELLAPRLVGGSLALFGSFVTLFVALVWLGIVVQILLLGAAWLQVVTRVTPGRGSLAGPGGGGTTPPGGGI
ncbi:MAG: YihY/virulence factor BrkB family protein, partial [Chloroflexi bacterium]|nr:YihY/virulence factor BrkB family protein [Chloroflexota bacterium]